MTRTELDDLIRESHAALEQVDDLELMAMRDAFEDLWEAREIEAQGVSDDAE